MIIFFACLKWVLDNVMVFTKQLGGWRMHLGKQDGRNYRDLLSSCRQGSRSLTFLFSWPAVSSPL